MNLPIKAFSNVHKEEEMMMRHLPQKDRTILASSYAVLYFALYYIVFAPGSSFGDVLSLFTMVFMAYLIVYYFIYPLFTRVPDRFIGLISPVSFIVASMTYLLSDSNRVLVTVLAAYVGLLFILLLMSVTLKKRTSRNAKLFVKVVDILTRPDGLYLPILLVFSYVFTSGDFIVTLFILLLTLGKPLDRIMCLILRRREINRQKNVCDITHHVLIEDRSHYAHWK
ncbi:MAG: hypothetical protein K9K93_05120 [Acholeplasmataceae bacterium]|nr:hypothetical protein [Acholeplasmataceae bacterium]